jgi:hypothetical protein
MPHLLSLLLLLSALAGCATRPVEKPSAPPAFPKEAFITQRGVLKARGKEFTLNGYVSVSEAGGQRLIVTENFGKVMADVLLKPDGTVHVMRSDTVFKPAWVRRFVASDFQCLFGTATKKKCRVAILSPTHFRVKRFWYSLDLHTLQIKPGAQPAEMFDETKAQP